jgi:uncharacterized membrane protein YesL
MMLTGAMGGIYRVTEWITKFAYISILWMFFSLLGLILFGLFPATISTFVITRKWIQGYTDIPLTKTFWQTYKKDFKKGNIIGFIYYIIGYFLYLDFHLIFITSNSALQITTFSLVLISLVLLLTLLYVFPVYVSYELKIIDVLKNAFIISVFRPLNTLMMIAGAIAVYGLMRFIPGLIPFFAISLWAYINMGCANLVFKKLNQNQLEKSKKLIS